MKHIILLGLVISVLVYGVIEIRRYETGVMESHVGESVIVNGDTLTIISFSTFTDEYLLSNGMSVSDAYLTNIK